MKEYKVNQKVWAIKINKYKEPQRKYSSDISGVSIKEHRILGISKYKICLDNEWFTTLGNDTDKREKYYTYLDDVNVSIRTNNNILGNGVFATMYSTTEPTEKLLKKICGKISNKIDKDYGFLFSGVKEEVWDLIKDVKFE